MAIKSKNWWENEPTHEDVRFWYETEVFLDNQMKETLDFLKASGFRATRMANIPTRPKFMRTNLDYAKYAQALDEVVADCYTICGVAREVNPHRLAFGDANGVFHLRVPPSGTNK